MKKKYILFIAIFLLTLVGCNKEDNSITPSTKGSIYGKITDFSSGSAISGVTLSTQPATIIAISNASGNYAISNVEAGKYLITAAKNGYFQDTTSINVKAGQKSIANFSLALDPIIPNANVSYKMHIAPVFEVKCVPCHNSQRSEAGLDLSSWVNATRDPSIIFPGSDSTSILVYSIERIPPYAPMPPNEWLKRNHIDGIRTWIREGAQNN